MDKDRTSPTLLDRLRDPADGAAWARFEAAYGDLVVRYCRAKGLQVADAEDAWQLTLVKLSRAISKFKYDRARGRFRDYLFVVVRSVLATGAYRTGGHRAGVTGGERISGDEVPEEFARATCDDETWEREWRDFHFRRAWSSIARDFEAQSLAAFECLLAGQGVRQVADRFAMTEPGLHKIKQRVRDRLAEQIRVQVLEEDGVG